MILYDSPRPRSRPIRYAMGSEHILLPPAAAPWGKHYQTDAARRRALPANAKTSVLASHLPGREGVVELSNFAAGMGMNPAEMLEPLANTARYEIWGRLIDRARRQGAQIVSDRELAEVFFYKRYLIAADAAARIERRLVARYTLALVDFGYDVERAAEAAARNYGLAFELAADEIAAAMLHFSGGFATWKDEPGGPLLCSRCRQAVACALDVDKEYRCRVCTEAVRMRRAAGAPIDENAIEDEPAN